ELFASSTYASAPLGHAQSPARVAAGGDSGASLLARDRRGFQPAAGADQVAAPAKPAAPVRPIRVASLAPAAPPVVAPAKPVTIAPPQASPAPPVHVASLSPATPPIAALHPAPAAVASR